jgi:hypothetical protein
MMMRKIWWFAVGVLIIATVVEAHGAPKGPREGPWEKISVRAGGFLTALDTSVKLGLTEGTGLEISLEDSLGVRSSLWSFRADALWRFTRNDRHRLDLTYLGYYRSATRVIQEDIPVGDDTIEAGTVVDTTYNLQIIRLVYSWSFLMDERVDLGIGGGFYIMPITLRIKGEEKEPRVQEFTAPLPVLDLRADFLIAPKWYFRQRYGFFFLAIGDFSGGVIDTELSIEYRFWKYTGVGLGFNSFRLAVQAENPNAGLLSLDGRIQTTYNGLLLYGKFYW